MYEAGDSCFMKMTCEKKSSCVVTFCKVCHLDLRFEKFEVSFISFIIFCMSEPHHLNKCMSHVPVWTCSSSKGHQSGGFLLRVRFKSPTAHIRSCPSCAAKLPTLAHFGPRQHGQVWAPVIDMAFCLWPCWWKKHIAPTNWEHKRKPNSS